MAQLSIWHQIVYHIAFVTTALSLNKPNILFILVDDLGWNDICFHGSCGFSTPNIDNLAINYGLQLNNYYVNSACSPTRAAFLSGRYATRTGMNHRQLSPFESFGFPLRYTLLSQDLLSAGYDTYVFGKWHLGYFHEAYTPTFRGFNTFYGFYNGMEDFWNHTVTVGTYERYDLVENNEPVRDANLHTYSTYIYRNKTLDVIQQWKDDADTDKQPFFIYLSLQNVHLPLQAPQDIIDSMISIDNENRKTKVAMATVVDNVIGDIVQLLNDTDLWDDLLLVFSTDNGAASDDAGSNYPLRGTKGTLWEGSVRGAAFISGGYLNASRYGQVTDELLHVTDFYPTICDIVGVNATDSDDFDGMSFINILQNEDGKSQRDEVLLNIDPVACNNSWDVCGGIRFGDWKLLVGDGEHQVARISEPFGSDDICVAGWCTGDTDVDYYDVAFLPTVQCVVNNETKLWNLTDIYDECPFNDEPCLFNITNDPCEFFNVAADNLDIVEYGLERLMYWQNTQMVTPLNVLNPSFDLSKMPESDYWLPYSNTSDMIMWDTEITTSQEPIAMNASSTTAITSVDTTAFTSTFYPMTTNGSMATQDDSMDGAIHKYMTLFYFVFIFAILSCV